MLKKIRNAKDVLIVTVIGLKETFTDRKVIIILLIIGFILDNGVRGMVSHGIQIQQPLGFLEGFIMCINHWHYVVVFLVGFLFLISSVPRLDSHQILLIYRIGKKNWFFGEVLQIIASAFIFTFILLLGCIAVCAQYSFIGDKWSNYTSNYKQLYETVFAGSNLYIDEQVYKYYMPYKSALHGFILLVFCMIVMGTIVLFFSIIEKKIAGIILNIILVLFVLVFFEYRSNVMWLSPFCHAIIMLHNVYIFKQLSVPLYYSYIYMASLEGILIFLSLKMLKNKMFY